MMLIAGGSRDPNIACMVSAASRAGVHFAVAYSDLDDIQWDMTADMLTINGFHQPFDSLFHRVDVFGVDQQDQMAVSRAWSWYHVLRAYALSHDVRMLDRDVGMAMPSKALALTYAAEAGLNVPVTVIAANYLGNSGGFVVKPLEGGNYTRMLSEAADAFRSGHEFIQEHLHGPEHRIYVCDDRCVCFRMRSSSLDYRVKQDVQIEYVSGLLDESEKVRQVAKRIGVTFGAADLKATSSGKLCFLEMNSNPMFSAFDRVCGGMISSTLVDLLTRKT